MSGHRLAPAERAAILRWRQTESLSTGDILARCKEQGWSQVPSKSTLSLLLRHHPRSSAALAADATARADATNLVRWGDQTETVRQNRRLMAGAKPTSTPSVRPLAFLAGLHGKWVVPSVRCLCLGRKDHRRATSAEELAETFQFMLPLPAYLCVVIVGSFGRAPHTLLAALPCELLGKAEVAVGVPAGTWPSTLWRSAGEAVLLHTRSGNAGRAFDAWWNAWRNPGIAAGATGSRLDDWMRVLALDDRKDPVVRWWLNGGRGAAPEPVFPLV